MVDWAISSWFTISVMRFFVISAHHALIMAAVSSGSSKSTDSISVMGEFDKLGISFMFVFGSNGITGVVSRSEDFLQSLQSCNPHWGTTSAMRWQLNQFKHSHYSGALCVRLRPADCGRTRFCAFRQIQSRIGRKAYARIPSPSADHSSRSHNLHTTQQHCIDSPGNGGNIQRIRSADLPVGCLSNGFERNNRQKWNRCRLGFQRIRSRYQWAKFVAHVGRFSHRVPRFRSRFLRIVYQRQNVLCRIKKWFVFSKWTQT